MEKMMKISKNLNIFANVAKHIFRVAAVIIALAAVILLFLSPHHPMWQNGTYSLTLGNVALELIPDGAIPAEATRSALIIGLVFCVPVLFFSAKCLAIIQDILTPMTQGKPFDTKVADSLKKLSFIVLAAGAVMEVGKVALSALLLNSIRLDALFNPELVAGYTVKHVLSMNFIFLFAVLYLMSHVFRYGEELQQLSDETL